MIQQAGYYPKSGRSSTPMPVAPTAMWAGAGAIFLAISRFHQHVTILGRISAPALLSIAALGLLAASTDRWRPQDLRRHWIPKGIGVMTAIAIVGVPFTIYPGNAFTFLNEAFLRTLLLAIVAWAMARTPAGARFLAKTIAVSGATAAALAYFVGRSDSSGRLAGAYSYDPNDIALISVVTLPLIIWWAVDRRNKLRFLALLPIPILFQVIIRSDSRSGFLGLAAVVLGFLWLAVRRTPTRLKRLSTTIAAFAVVSAFFLPADYVDRIKTITSDDDYNRSSETGRTAIWKRGIGYALQFPIFGVGIDNFHTAEGRISELAQNRQPGQGLKWSAAHNSFVQVLAELGLIGGTVFLVLVIRTILGLLGWHRRRERAPPDLDLLAPHLGLSFAGFAVTGFFLSFAYYDLVYVLFALAAAVFMSAAPGNGQVTGVTAMSYGGPRGPRRPMRNAVGSPQYAGRVYNHSGPTTTRHRAAVRAMSRTNGARSSHPDR